MSPNAWGGNLLQGLGTLTIGDVAMVTIAILLILETAVWQVGGWGWCWGCGGFSIWWWARCCWGGWRDTGIGLRYTIPGRRSPTPPPVDLEQQEYVIERIKTTEIKGGQVKYLVSWRGGESNHFVFYGFRLMLCLVWRGEELVVVVAPLSEELPSTVTGVTTTS